MSTRRAVVYWALAAVLFVVLRLQAPAPEPSPDFDASAPTPAAAPADQTLQSGQPQPGGEPATAPTPAAIDPSAITRLEIRGRPSLVRLQRSGGGFDVTLPPGGVVAPGLVDALLEQLGQSTAARPLGDPSELASFGLAPPRLVLVLTMRDGSERRLELGDRNPAMTAVYARFDALPGAFLVGLNLAYYADLVRQALGADALDRSSAAGAGD